MADHDGPLTPNASARAQEVRDFVEKLTNERLHLSDLDEDTHQALEAHIAAVKGQLESEAPESGLIDEALDAVHRLLGSSTTQKATELLQEAGRFLTGVG
jgi:hypothetical protein